MQHAPLRLIAPDGAPPHYRFDELDADGGLVHAIFSRHGGVSRAPFDTLNVSTSSGDDAASVEANRNRVLATIGRPRAGLVMAGMIHGTTVARVGAGARGKPLDGGGHYVPSVDALMTDDPHVTLLITAADCAQVLFVDPVRRAVGIAHAGWRGSAAGILTATVRAMHEHFGSAPGDLRAAVGPCLGPCCARFSDPGRELPGWCAPFIHGNHIDLWAMNLHQLIDAGLDGSRIAVARVCTVCSRDTFFSHRGDGGRTGRFAAAIGLL